MAETHTTPSLLPSLAYRGDGRLVSVHLNSNRPVQIVTFLEAIERTAAHPARIEVIVHIDEGDERMGQVLQQQQKKLTLTLKWFATDLIKSFADTWKPYNAMLAMTDPNAYFITLLSDEMLFEQSGWDSMLEKYVGYFPDHIFRLRASKYRLRNYTDVWECGFAPDSIAFYTRDWLMIQGQWNPCNGPDSFQQCVSFYLYTSDPFSHTQHCRDVEFQFVAFSGEGVSHGMNEEAKQRRFMLATRMWFILMSHRYQQEAKRCAMLLKAHIVVRSHPMLSNTQQVSLADSSAKKEFILQQGGNLLAVFSYGLSYTAITLRNVWRALRYHYYGGGGREALESGRLIGIQWVIKAYCPALVNFARKIKTYLPNVKA